MWVTKIILPYNKENLLAEKTKKFGVTIYGYPISHFVKNKVLHVITIGTIFGNEQAIQRCINELRKEKRMLALDVFGRFGIAHMIQPRELLCLYRPLVFHVKPAAVTTKGEYIWELASWNRVLLEKVISVLHKPKYKGKMAYIKQQPLKNFQILSIVPTLTEKQKHCLDLAVQYGYYGCPRRITLKKLAQYAKISYSTYQFHLQNAERKLIPSLNDLGIYR